MPIPDSFVPDKMNGPAAGPPIRVLSTDGAVPIAAGIVFITKATAAVITLDTPPMEMNGATLKIISTTAAAHTVTHTPGFGGGGAARDVATFGGAISDGLELAAYNGVWYVANSRNITIA